MDGLGGTSQSKMDDGTRVPPGTSKRNPPQLSGSFQYFLQILGEFWDNQKENQLNSPKKGVARRCSKQILEGTNHAVMDFKPPIFSKVLGEMQQKETLVKACPWAFYAILEKPFGQLKMDVHKDRLSAEISRARHFGCEQM